MPFVFTVLLAPLTLCFAIYRLIHIPMQLQARQIRLHRGASSMPAVLACVAYLALLLYTVGLCSAVVWCLATQPQDFSEIVRVFLYFEAYPLAFVMAEWRFFYGFDTAPRKGGAGSVSSWPAA
jgi:hypothetical protein